MSLTDPWAPDSDALLRTHPDPIVRAWAVTPSLTFPLDVEPGSTLTFDETSAPRVTGRLVVTAPTFVQQSALDPRAGVRILVDAGYRRPGGVEDVHPCVNLGLRTRPVALGRGSSTIGLTVAGDEALVIDGAAAVGDTVNTATTASGIAQLIAAAITPTPVIAVRASGPAVNVTPITDRWSALRDMAERATLTAYDAGLRAWVIESRPVLVGDSAAILSIGPTGTLEAWEETISRDDEWANYVIYRYAWRDAGGVNQTLTATAYVADGPYSITGAAGRRMYAEDRDVPTTQAAANAAAADALSRLVTRGRTVDVRALAAWWLRPGMTVTLQGPAGMAQERHLVQRVTFDLGAGSMDVRTRTPLTFTTATTTPPAAPPVADPTPPAKTTYVSVWTSNASATYKGDGTKRLSSDTNNLVQGYTTYYPANGNGQAIALFTGANSTPDLNVTGETGKTIAQALTGVAATDVLKVEIELYFEHWSYTAGTARLGRYTGTAIPATFTGASPVLASAGWGRAVKRWVDVTAVTDKASLIAGTHGWTLGPGIGTDMTYYGRAQGHLEANPPRCRITYAKP